MTTQKKIKAETIVKIFGEKKHIRIGIIGEVGVGKSRFLNLLLDAKKNELDDQTEFKSDEGPFGYIASGKPGTTFPVEVKYRAQKDFDVILHTKDDQKVLLFETVNEIKMFILET